MPLRENDPGSALDPGSRPRSDTPKPSVQRALVLVIDDNVHVRTSLDLLLTGQYRVLTAGRAVEGVKAFNDEVCSVVLDVKMKPHDGFWACDEIRKISQDVPIIFYSAYQNTKDPFEIINRHRPFAYLVKDGDAEKLLATIETATQLHRTTLRSRRIIEQIRGRRAGTE